ncbi:MAG: GSCFA domain-containing protein [Rhodospirillaceae bacterium]|nr:GSCFA domain-containing protein [Rhodospirillaceae bacterium]
MARHLFGFPKRVIGPQHPDLEAVIRESVIGPGAPAQPLIGPDSKVASFGSCFAGEIAAALTKNGQRVANSYIAERYNSAFMMDAFLASILDGESTDAVDTLFTKPDLADVSLFILTFGMSLCWFNANGSLVVEPGKSHAEEGLISAMRRYTMRQTSVEQNEAAIRSCIARISKHFPQAHIVVTLSPIPMLAAVGHNSIMVANTLSKSTLRIAIDRALTGQPENVHYWPSYELVNWYGGHVESAFGSETVDSRHLKPEVIDIIIRLFLDYYVAKPAAAAAAATS